MPVILLVVGFEENAVDPTDVSALVLQADANGAALPAEQSISQEELDEMISSGRMPVRDSPPTSPQHACAHDDLRMFR
eukprot:COSAG02_NODE_4430_length_5367_cov_3.587699_5_plen_78_part_00